SATAAVGRLSDSITSNRTLALLGSKAPRQRRGRNALIGVRGNRLADSGTIGPWADRLYAVEPAGVEISTPSQESSASRTRPSTVIRIFADWRICRHRLTSL